jgi:prepilin-type N-terminal cleavage/methylation domain-containing protein
MASRPTVTRRDEGLTLVELIIVTTLLGIVATVIAAAFVTILQVSPATQYRIDDARSVRALQTWLVRDVASTPPNEMSDGELDTGGYIFSNGDTSWLTGSDVCGAGAGNIVHMTWNDGGVRYNANYRIDGGRIIRNYCAGGSMSTVRLAGDVSTTFCATPAFATSYSFPFPSADDLKSVEICVRSSETDTGLNGGGGDTQDIVLSVSSRNYVNTP